MEMRLDIYNKQFFYNRFYQKNVFQFKPLGVYHFVEPGDPFYWSYSQERLVYRSLLNLFWLYRQKNVLFDWEKYLSWEIKMICLGSNFVSDGITHGTVKLHFSIPGKTFVASDKNGDGVLFWEHSPGFFVECGFVFYEHGIIILFGKQTLDSVHKENYRSMVGVLSGGSMVYDEGLYSPKWVYFGNVGNDQYADACKDTSFVIECDCRSDLYKDTFFLTAKRYNWVNSPLFYMEGGGLTVTPNFVGEVVAGGEEISGVRAIPYREVSIHSASWFNRYLSKQGTVSLASPVFLKFDETTTIKVSFDY